MQTLLVKDSLPHLAKLALTNACEVVDNKSQLQQLSNLEVTYDTLNKAYHGEWYHNLTHLLTKSPCNVPLGLLGLYPTTLRKLQLHTECPEPVKISTAHLPNQPKPYPHQVHTIPACL